MSERKRGPDSPLPPKSEEPDVLQVPLSERPTLPPKPEQREDGKLNVQVETMARFEGKSENQDDSLVALSKDGETGLFGVADGVGGNRGGEVASGMTNETLEKSLPAMEEIRERRKNGDAEATVESEAGVLRRAIKEANEKVSSKREHILALDRMGSTCATVRLTLDEAGQYHAIIAHVGDSRVYLSHPDGKLETLTLDDNMALMVAERKRGLPAALRVQDVLDNSLGEEQLDILIEIVKKGEAFPENGILSKEDIQFLMDNMEENWLKYYHQNSNRVFNTIGSGVDVHIKTIPVARGSKLILATDGIDGLLRDEIELIAAGRMGDLPYQAARRAAESWADDIARAMVHAAKERQKETKPPHFHPRSRGPDDTTVVVVEVPKR